MTIGACGPRCGLGGQRLLPAAQHPPDFVSGGLALKYFRLINNLQLEAQSQLQGRDLKVTTRLNEVTGLERFRRILGHNQLAEQVEHAILEALAE